jgi:hypothetical protein
MMMHARGQRAHERSVIMKAKLLCVVFAGALALSACETTGGYGGGYSGGRTQLSQCTRNALIGAGIGAVAGAVVGD